MLNFKRYNVNPKGKKTGDCSIRALACCLNITWEEALTLLYQKALKTKLDTADRKNMEAVLKDFGYEKQKQPRKLNGKKYTVDEMDNVLSTSSMKKGVIVNVANHYVCIKDGCYVDTWNSGHKSVGNYYIKLS